MVTRQAPVTDVYKRAIVFALIIARDCQRRRRLGRAKLRGVRRGPGHDSAVVERVTETAWPFEYDASYVRVLKVEATETLLYGGRASRGTRTRPNTTDYRKPTIQCSSDAPAGANRSAKTTHTLAYANAHIKTDSESIERRCADGGYCWWVSWHERERSACRKG